MEIVARADQAAGMIPPARSRRAFLHALAEFEHLLGAVRDYPRGCITPADGDGLRAIAGTVIAHVERRLDARCDRASVQRDLAGTIERIRADVEAIDLLLRCGCRESVTERRADAGRLTVQAAPARR